MNRRPGHDGPPGGWARPVFARGFRSLPALVLAALLGWLSSNCAAAEDGFAHGVELARAGQFPEAVAAFESSARRQPAAGTLLNLGLAQWQAGHAGAAILAWEQARWIDPFDARATANLEFARQAAQVEAPRLTWYEAVSTWLPAADWAWLASGAFWLAVGLLLLPGIFRRHKSGWHQWLAALAFGVFLLGLTACFGLAGRTQIGFVLKKNAVLQLTPTHDGEVLSTLAAGEPAHRLRARGNYVFVRTYAGTGWLEQSGLGLICPR